MTVCPARPPRPPRAPRALRPRPGALGAAAIGLALAAAFVASARAEDPPRSPEAQGLDAAEYAARLEARRELAEAAQNHARYARTYGEALWEARLRNLPVLVTRHKDH